MKDCVVIRNQIIQSGDKNSSGRHEVPSVIIMSGTRVRYLGVDRLQDLKND